MRAQRSHTHLDLSAIAADDRRLCSRHGLLRTSAVETPEPELPLIAAGSGRAENRESCFWVGGGRG